MRTSGLVCALGALIITGVLAGGCQGGGKRACTDDTQCDIGSTCSEKKACVATACAVDRECPAGSVCEGSKCAEGCRSSLDCPASAGICDAKRGGVGDCVACLETADCPARHECKGNACLQSCRTDTDCASGHCDAKARSCVECLEDAHCGTGKVCDDDACIAGCSGDQSCPPTAPRCQTDRGDHGACVQCRGDADCANGTCRPDGTCASRALDVLFVVDDSSGMIKAQQDLGKGMAQFLAALDTGRGLPDLHIGVVSTDLGTGTQIVSGCSTSTDQDGDGAELRRTPMIPGCTAPTGAFLRDVASSTGRERNYSGTLPDAFACISELGDDGCGFEQPLAAMRKALDGSVAANAGFLRPDAALAVFILTNEDDCSVTDTQLFTSSTTTLGPRISFRCFEVGTRCEPDAPRTVGKKAGCVPRAPSPYMAAPETYVEFLRGVKPAGRVAVSVFAMPSQDVEVMVDPLDASRLTLKHACPPPTSGVSGFGDPAVRLDAFATAFGAPIRTSFCTGDLGASLRDFGAAAGRLLN